MSKPFNTLKVRTVGIQSYKDLDLWGDPLMKQIKLQTMMLGGYPSDTEEWIVDSLLEDEDSWTQLRPY
jgi:hypothetical protein